MSQASIHVVYAEPGGEGHLCIFHMARLAAELLIGELLVVQLGYPTLADKVSGIILPRKRSRASCLLICSSPADLRSILPVRITQKL
jgi:hypothetical protein